MQNPNNFCSAGKYELDNVYVNYQGPEYGNVLFNTSNNNATACYADGKGKYEITGLTEGSYTVRPVPPTGWYAVDGLTDGSVRNVNVVDNGNHEVWFLLDKTPSSTIRAEDNNLTQTVGAAENYRGEFYERGAIFGSSEIWASPNDSTNPRWVPVGNNSSNPATSRSDAWTCLYAGKFVLACNTNNNNAGKDYTCTGNLWGGGES
jgi:hypothetical protein